MRRKKVTLPPPPCIAAIAIDGANVIGSGAGRARQRLDQAIAWCAAWRPDLPVAVFLDRSTFDHCPAPVQQQLAALAQPGAALQFELCAAGTVADAPLLQYAGRHRALVIANDRYFDHAELRANVVTLQFELRLDRFRPFPEATWFRTPGTAVRVPLAVLQAQRGPA